MGFQPDQKVLLLQGGGALGAYQAGLYCGLSERALRPDWIVGTSIGAINGALIAGNPPGRRPARLKEFWQRVGTLDAHGIPARLGGRLASNWLALSFGVGGFFRPRLWPEAPQRAGATPSLYDTTPLRETLSELVDFDHLNGGGVRLSVGAVEVRSGTLRYFDTARERLTVDHILASGALPPAFPAVRIGDELYWDGGIFSNTPLDYVLSDRPRRHSLCFLATLWQSESETPTSLPEVLGRVKDIQYASRATNLIELEQKIHRLRHAVNSLVEALPNGVRRTRDIASLAQLGCISNYHLVRFQAPRLAHDDHTKDIDFTSSGIAERWQAGVEDARAAADAAAWTAEASVDQGIWIHDARRASARLAQA